MEESQKKKQTHCYDHSQLIKAPSIPVRHINAWNRRNCTRKLSNITAANKSIAVTILYRWTGGGLTTQTPGW